MKTQKIIIAKNRRGPTHSAMGQNRLIRIKMIENPKKIASNEMKVK
jgi:hypothetical protein